MERPSPKGNGLQTRRASRGLSRSAKISRHAAQGLEGLLERIEGLYQDVATGDIELETANTLNRILGRHVAVMALAERVDRTRDKSKKSGYSKVKWAVRDRV